MFCSPAKPLQGFGALPHRLSLIPLVVFKDVVAQAVEGRVEGFAIIHFSEVSYEGLQIGVVCYHEGDDRNFQSAQLSGEVERAVEYFTVYTKTVLVVFVADLEA